MSLHKYGIRAGKQLWACRLPRSEGRKLCYRTRHPDSPERDFAGLTVEAPSVYQRELTKKTFIYTAAQNNTPVHAGFWAALQHAAKDKDAEVVVLPYMYRNPTSRNEEPVWYAGGLAEYLWSVRHKVNKNLEVLGDVPIQATAENPLSGLEGFTGHHSCIVAHPKLECRTVAQPASPMAKIMTTTGSCTVAGNYSRSKAGAKAEFHHTLGAVLVEAEGNYFWLRHLIAHRDGSFTDLDKRYTASGVEKAPRPEGFVLGDVHRKVHDAAVDALRWGESGIVPWLQPKNVIWHDTHDAYAENPHEVNDPFIRFGKQESGADVVEREVLDDIEFIRARTPKFAQTWIVASNHDDMLRRWVVRQDWRQDLPNARFYLRSALAMLSGAKDTLSGVEYPDPFIYWVEQAKLPRVKCLNPGRSLVIAGIQCGMHGDKGPKGARGSRKNLRRIGEKTFSGHVHGPGIDEGAWSVGTGSRLDLMYARSSPSDWAHCDGIIYAGGKRQLIFYVKGRYRR